MSYFLFMKQTILWFITFLLFVVVFVLIIYFIPSYEESNLDTSNIQNFIFKERILSCFSDGEMHKIDLNKFDGVTIKNCIDPKENIGGVFSLTYLNNSKIKDVKVNDNLINGLDFCNLKGSPYKCNSYKNYILISNNEGVILKAEVISKI